MRSYCSMFDRHIEEERKEKRNFQTALKREHSNKVRQAYENIYHTNNNPEQKKQLEAYLKLLV